MKRDWWDKEFQVLTTVGDSITAGGWASCRERAWPEQLTRTINEYQRVPAQLVNMGVGANVLSPKSAPYEVSGKPSVSERLGYHVLGQTGNGNPLLPDLLVFACCSCDARGGTPILLFCDEMNYIICCVRAKVQPLIVLVGPYHTTDYEEGAPNWSHASPRILGEYNEAIRTLAGYLGCLFVDLLAAHDGADWLVHHDGVHMNDVGHRAVADEIFRVLVSNCSGLAIETLAGEESIVPWRNEVRLQDDFYLPRVSYPRAPQRLTVR